MAARAPVLLFRLELPDTIVLSTNVQLLLLILILLFYLLMLARELMNKNGTSPLFGATIASPLADQTTSRIVAELGKSVCLRRGLNCYHEDVKRNKGNSLALQTSLALIRFYLIGYWRLKPLPHFKIYKISQ